MRLLIKFGTAVMTRDNRLNYTWLEKKAEEISELVRQGSKIIIVSSGAVAAGMETLNLKQHPKKTTELQALSGIGQVRLANTFAELFKKNKIDIAQVLLTHHNFSTEEEKKNLKDVINNYLNKGIIPIINENDVVSKEELMSNSQVKFTDNDILAALVAVELKVDSLLLITDVDGLCTVDPKKDSCADVIEEVKTITADIEKLATKETNALGRGGMISKVLAAKKAKKHNIKTIVGSGSHNIKDLLEGNVKRTLFGC